MRFIPFAVGQSDATRPNPLLAGREVLWSDLVAPQQQPIILVSQLSTLTRSLRTQTDTDGAASPLKIPPQAQNSCLWNFKVSVVHHDLNQI